MAAAPLYYGDVLYLFSGSSNHFCSGDGLVDSSLSLKSELQESFLGLFRIQKTQNDSQSGSEGGREGVYFGAETLFQHQYSGLYLSMDPFSPLKVQLSSLNEKCRVRIVPVPSAKDCVGDLVTGSARVMLVFEYRKTQFGLRRNEELRLDVGEVPEEWRLKLAFDPVTYPKITPFSFIHIQNASFPVYLSLSDSDLHGLPDNDAIGTYWQVEPGKEPGHYRLKSLKTQRYMQFEGEEDVAVVTTGTNNPEITYQSSCLLVCQGRVLGVSSDSVTFTATNRLLCPSSPSSSLHFQFNTEKSYFQCHPADTDTAHALNRLCRVADSMRRMESVEGLEGVCRQGLNWVLSNQGSIGQYLSESGLPSALLAAYVRLVNSHLKRKEYASLSSLALPACQVLLSAITHTPHLFLPLFPSILWLRQRLEPFNPDPSTNFDLLCRLLLNKSTSISPYPCPQNNPTAVDLKTQGNPALWVKEIDEITDGNVGYQSIVMDVLNHMMWNSGKYYKNVGMEIVKEIEGKNVPKIGVWEGEMVVIIENVTKNAFLRANPRLKDVVNTTKSGISLSFLRVLSKKSGDYSKYLLELLLFQGLLQPINHNFDISILISALKDSRNENIQLLRGCLRVLAIVGVPRWRRETVYEAVEGKTGTCGRLGELREIVMGQMEAEWIGEVAEVEHTNALLYLEEIVHCSVLLLRSFSLDPVFLLSLNHLCAMLLSGFGLPLSPSSWISHEIRSSLKANLTTKRHLILQRLFTQTVKLLYALIETRELLLIWQVLDARNRKQPLELPETLISASFALNLAVEPPSSSSSPLLPNSPPSHLPGKSLISLLQRLIFTQFPLLSTNKPKILRISERISTISDKLTQAMYAIARTNDNELHILMDFISSKAQKIDNLLENSEISDFEPLICYLETVTDLLMDHGVKKVIQISLNFLKIHSRIHQISLKIPTFPSNSREKVTYLLSLYHKKCGKMTKSEIIDPSKVHFSTICDVLFLRSEVRQAGNDERSRLVEWTMQQTNLRAVYLLKKLVLNDFYRLENALLVAKRLISRVKEVEKGEMVGKGYVEMGVYFHVLAICCRNSELVRRQVMYMLKGEMVHRMAQHPAALSGIFELLLTLLEETDSNNQYLVDYFHLVVRQIRAKMEELVANKAIDLMDLGEIYDQIGEKMKPEGRRKRKNELFPLENASLPLFNWKLLITSDKLTSKGVISVFLHSFSSPKQPKSLFKYLDPLLDPLRHLIYIVIERQKWEEKYSYERLIRRLKVGLEVLEQRKERRSEGMEGFRFISALSKGRNREGKTLFPVEIPKEGLELSQAEGYLRALYAILHQSDYLQPYMDAIGEVILAIQPGHSSASLCNLMISLGLLNDILEAINSPDLTLCKSAFRVLISLLKSVSVTQRNSVKAYIEQRKVHGIVLGKYCGLISGLCSQAGDYGVKCEQAIQAGREPTSVPVVDSFYEKLEVGLEFLRFVQLTCDLCNKPFQTFYSQWPYSGTESAVWTLAKGLSDLRQSIHLFLSLRGNEVLTQLGTNETETLHISFALGDEVCRLVAGLLDGLQELATGPCEVNQSLMSRNSHLLLAVNQLLSVTVQADFSLYGKTVDLMLALTEGDPSDAVIDRLVEGLNLSLCLKQIESAYTSQTPGNTEAFTKLFIFLLTIRQRRPTHAVLAGLPTASCYGFYLRKVGYVEVMMEEQVKGLYFPIPGRVRHMTARTRASVIWDIDRSSQMKQINEFVQRIKVWDYEMKHQARISALPLVKLLTAQWRRAGWVGLVLIVALNVLLVWQVQHPDQLIDGSQLPYRQIYTILGILQTVMGVIQYVCYYIEYYPNMLSEQEITQKEILKGLVVEQPLALPTDHAKTTVSSTQSNIFTVLFCRWDSLRFLSYLLCSLLAFYYPFCYGLLLLDIIRKNGGIEAVLQSITINKGRLLLTFCLGLLMVYIFSIFAFVFFREELNGVNGIECSDLLHCFTSLFGVGVKSQGEMISMADPSTPWFWFRLLFDVSFFILVIVILLNITFGIILNSFSQLRDEKNKKLKDIYSRCYVCGHHRSEINLKGGGWKWHLVGEHSPFAYVAFLVYLMDKPEDQCSGLEQYVKVLYSADNYSFMPTSSKRLLESSS